VTKDIVWLKDINKNDIDLVGGKAANLGELYNNGFNVPNACVISTKVYQNYSKNGKFNDEVRNNILVVFTKLDRNVSVRSSATAEDLENASFAGQYSSFLNVDTEKKLFDSIVKCFKSIDSKRAIAYRKKNKVKGKINMAVIIQKMIPSINSGVSFTVNPTNNDSNQMVIELVNGLGDSLVSGSVTPDSYVIDKKSKKIVKKSINSNKNISAQKLKKVLEVSNKIEQHYNQPQDIEFAFADKLYVLQSRPITTLKKQESWKKIISREYGVQYCEISLRTLSPELKNHVPYQFYDQIYVPEEGNQVCYMKELQWDKFVQKVEQKYNLSNIKMYEKDFFQRGQDYVDYCKFISNQDLSKKSNIELYKIYQMYQKFSLKYTPYVWTSYVLNLAFSKRVKEIIDSNVKNNSHKYYESVFTPSKKAAILQLNEDIKNSKSNGLLFEKYKWLPCLDIHNLPWTKDEFLEFVKDHKIPENSDKRISYGNVLSKFKIKSEYKKLFDTCKRFAYIKDVKDDFRRQGIFNSQCLFQEIASRMRKKLIDISYMMQGEISEFLKVGKVSKNVKERQKGFVIFYENATVRCVSGKNVNDIVSRFGIETNIEYSEKIQGLGASSGIVQGKVVIVKTLKDLSKVKKNDIMVAVTTHPDYVPAMQRASAIVTDEGGITSHAAIVARELQMPCVVGTKVATKLLKNNDLVEVDGSKAIVKKILKK